jgi:uncharacterized protein (TIRG00374 family)
MSGHSSAGGTRTARPGLVRDRTRTWLVRLGALALVPALLYFALRGTDWSRLADVLGGLQWWQLGIVLLVDGLIFALFAVRWWAVARGYGSGIRFAPLFAARLSAFGVSYFTIGPQIGGEPLQVAYLHARERLSLSHATASVIVDKLLELLSNYVLFLIAGAAIVRAGLLATQRSGYGFFALTMLLGLLPLAHVALLRRGILPISTALQMIPHRGPVGKARRFVKIAELLASRFFARRAASLALATGASLVAGILAVLEYALIASFAGAGLDLWQSIAGWGAGWLSFLVPVPGGAGALEAGQVFVLGRLGVAAESAVAIVLLMRVRDLVFGGVGLVLAAVLGQKGRANGARDRHEKPVPNLPESEFRIRQNAPGDVTVGTLIDIHKEKP